MNSYAEHKIYIPGSTCRFSIWYNAQGGLYDAERIDRRGRAYPVRRGGPQWRELRVWAARAAHYRRSRGQATKL